MDMNRQAIETWLLLDNCRLPPRVFTIIDALLDVIERQDEELRHHRSAVKADSGSEGSVDA